MTAVARSIPFLLLLFGAIGSAQNIQRFPPPDFESGYELPATQTPAPRSEFLSYLDLAVLLAALSAASYIVVKERSRKGIFVLSVFSLAYFGFYRQGCVCPIGSIQNVTVAIFESSYAIPLTVTAFFALPLLFTLFYGRVFCAGVCPLGAIQDLVLIKPVRIPQGLQHALGLIPYLYLGAAVLFAAMGSAFIICEYDPFVAFFRLSGNRNIVILGVSLLAISLFVGRPYCLFLCPYSVLLRLFARVSQWRLTISQDECVNCQRCEDACPFGAILTPTPEEMPNPDRKDRKRIVLLAVLAPAVIGLSAWVTSYAGAPFSRMDFTVRLAERIALEDAGQVEGYTDASKAFRDTGRSHGSLYGEARLLQERFVLGAWILGGFIGLVIICKLTQLSLFNKRVEYEIDLAGCVACGRCFPLCPRNKSSRQ